MSRSGTRDHPLAISPVGLFPIFVFGMIVVGAGAILPIAIYRHVQLKKYRDRKGNLARFEDPIAKQTSWDPLTPYGKMYCTHRLRQNVGTLEFGPSPAALALICFYAMLAASILLIGLTVIRRRWSPESLAPCIFLATMCLVFAGLFASRLIATWRFVAKPIVFDLVRKELPESVLRDGETGEPCGDVQPIPFSDIHSLQLICEYRREPLPRSGMREYFSFELNLVLKDGQRVNIVDHGNYKALQKDAHRLADALGIPLWDAWGED
jgi:hypothetical protein